MKQIALLALLIGIWPGVDAAPASRNATIARIHPSSVDRPRCPACAGYTRVYFSPAPWGTTDCRADAGDLRQDDWQLLALLLFAWKNNKAVEVEVDSASKPIDDVCRITAISVQ